MQLFSGGQKVVVYSVRVNFPYPMARILSTVPLESRMSLYDVLGSDTTGPRNPQSGFFFRLRNRPCYISTTMTYFRLFNADSYSPTTTLPDTSSTSSEAPKKDAARLNFSAPYPRFEGPNVSVWKV